MWAKSISVQKYKDLDNVTPELDEHTAKELGLTTLQYEYILGANLASKVPLNWLNCVIFLEINKE